MVSQFIKDNMDKLFNASPEFDAQITTLFESHLINPIIYTNMDEWVDYVLVFDQVIRHVNRHTNKQYTPPDDFIPMCYAKFNEYEDKMDDFQFMFSLMPIRHTHKYNDVMFVVRQSWKRLENTNSPQIKKYLEATYMRYIKISDDNEQLYNQIYEPFDDIIHTILDKRCHPYVPNHINIIDISTMKDYLVSHNIKPSDTIILSLSGGVDSMVCSYLLHILKQKFIALHINYSNREECHIEESMLRYWCGYLNVPFYIRKIDEINRPKCMEYNMRNTYEDYTKQVRYSAYLNTASEADTVFVMLGHNMDDSIENIFSNIASSYNLDNLYGMTPYSTQSFRNKHITFLRPLLSTWKESIYDIANKASIPFFIDSTPSWSQRGKFRDTVMPALTKWNQSFISGLTRTVDMIRETDKCLSTVINNSIPTFNTIDDVPTETIYWTKKFRYLKIIVSSKSVNEFINKIKLFQKNPHKLVLNVLNKCNLNKDTQIMIVKRSENIEFILP
jgi:tRNA(Ile)-lysidine synthetase-like protein